MPKTCDEPNCNNPRWSRVTGKCKFHTRFDKPKPVSVKQKKSLQEIKKTYKFLDNSHDNRCKGCGQFKPCDHSHLVPRSFNKKLEAVAENITYHCRECHLKWEIQAENVKTMLDYQTNLKRVKNIDINYYNLIINKHL